MPENYLSRNVDSQGRLTGTSVFLHVLLFHSRRSDKCLDLILDLMLTSSHHSCTRDDLQTQPLWTIYFYERQQSALGLR
ncbi:RNA polymerase II subunit A domain phosphatase [Fusarium oxysporum f. sp. albedinis]|nr:RNA polymerase II subunit A domain phosphatase [Fusarium oxysporum f. sp. albedinis]